MSLSLTSVAFVSEEAAPEKGAVSKKGAGRQRWVDFGAKIRAFRKSRKVTMLAAAEKSGFSRNFYQLLETGRSGIKMENVPRLADAIGLDLETAYEWAGFTAPEELNKAEPDPRQRVADALKVLNSLLPGLLSQPRGVLTFNTKGSEAMRRGKFPSIP